MTTLLIDADVLVYSIAASSEEAFDWGDGQVSLVARYDVAEARMVGQVRDLMEHLFADRAIMCLSDPDHNFRSDILPTYKHNRAKTRPPLLRKHLNAFVETCPDDVWSCFKRPGLEGDDIMGILASSRRIVDDLHKIMVTKDKDLKTISGFHHRIGDPKGKVFTVNEGEADRFHLLQALAGDATDGYHGCPGIGMDRAQKFIGTDEPFTGVESYDHEFKGGPRRGTVETRWREVGMATPWEAIVSHYVRAGLSEEVALQNARVARILRAEDYNFEKKEPILWEPKR